LAANVNSRFPSVLPRVSPAAPGIPFGLVVVLVINPGDYAEDEEPNEAGYLG
jgi:hypothetical protein